jgi:hypothetical protein
MRKQLQFLCLALPVVLAVITACGPKPTGLPFETIELFDHSQYSGPPRAILVTNQQEIGKLNGLVSQKAIDRLAELDFQQYFAIAVFRGRQATSGYDTIIERVARQGNKIVIYAQFWEPSPYYEVQEAATSPYHVIKVRRDGGVIQETELVLQSQVITPTPPSR